ncbi:hypothetical protein T492DRAFT_1124126 [Pavlovales sp. CCMP2436]|nr:hypothetical protein T492DRAFT_1124126 [Pavlovales sp. CCMP2436]
MPPLLLPGLLPTLQSFVLELHPVLPLSLQPLLPAFVTRMLRNRPSTSPAAPAPAAFTAARQLQQVPELSSLLIAAPPPRPLPALPALLSSQASIASPSRFGPSQVPGRLPQHLLQQASAS